MHSNKALTSKLMQFVHMAKSLIVGIYDKPDDEKEWRNISKLMGYFRQALACTMCGKIVSDPYTPVQEPCHCICANCRNDTQLGKNSHCPVCRNAFQDASGGGFMLDSDLKFSAHMFRILCKLLADKQMEHKWSSLPVPTPNGDVAFGQLIQEGCCSNSILNVQNLGEKYSKRSKEKEHSCRCGSTRKNDEKNDEKNDKKNDKKNNQAGILTCRGQRCTCYKERK